MKNYVIVTFAGFNPITREVATPLAAKFLAKRWARRGLRVSEVPYPVMAERPEIIKLIQVYRKETLN